MRTILRWLPAALLLALFGLLWKTAVSGGQQGVAAWLTLMGGLPYILTRNKKEVYHETSNN